MNESILIDRIQDKVFCRYDIYKAACELDHGFRETQLRNLLGELLDHEAIIRVGRNQYQKRKDVSKHIYCNTYSSELQDIISYMEIHFPLLDYCLWELSWLNEFVNHLIGRNFIFLEVENEGCDFVFEGLAEKYQGRVLVRPSVDEIMRYGVPDGIIIDRLVSEAPKGKPERYNLSLEKLIVDLFANKKLRQMVSGGDYPLALEAMFSKYLIDQNRLFRYARRRNKAGEIYHYLKECTEIEIVVEM